MFVRGFSTMCFYKVQTDVGEYSKKETSKYITHLFRQGTNSQSTGQKLVHPLGEWRDDFSFLNYVIVFICHYRSLIKIQFKLLLKFNQSWHQTPLSEFIQMPKGKIKAKKPYLLHCQTTVCQSVHKFLSKEVHPLEKGSLVCEGSRE